MPVEFTQDLIKDLKENTKIRGGRFYKDTIKVTPVARIPKFNYESNLKGKDKILIWKRSAESKQLINKINELIDEFNDLNFALSRYGNIPNHSASQFSISNATDRYFKNRGLSNHAPYLTQYTWEIHYNIVRTLERLCYTRTKEFEQFLKNLEGKKSDVILREILKFKDDKFEEWKKDVQLATVKNVDFMTKQIIEKCLKSKQESRKKQLLKKFKEWQKKLSDPTTKREEGFADVVDSLVELFSTGRHRSLSSDKINILKDCFGKDRSWAIAWSGSLAPQYNPYPSLDEGTNRVAIALFSLITDGDGVHIDPAIQHYLR